jgi:hypothetical protein
MSRMVSRIERLRTTPIVGNHYSDSGLFELAHDIIMAEDEPIENKLEAMDKMSEAMGGDYQPATLEELNRYIYSVVNDDY